MELRLVLSVADRAHDDLPALVADHQYLVEVFRSGHRREAVSALEDHLARGEVLARPGGVRARFSALGALRPAAHGLDGRAVAVDVRALTLRERFAAEQAVEHLAAHRHARVRLGRGGVLETVTPAPSPAVRYHVPGGAPVIAWAIVKSCPRVQVGWTA